MGVGLAVKYADIGDKIGGILVWHFARTLVIAVSRCSSVAL